MELNHYTELLEFIKSTAMEDTLVNVVTQGEFSTIDFDKMTIRPFVHINITGATFSNGSTVNMSVQIGAFNERIENKNINNDKFWRNDNEVDNMNTTLSILNRMWTKMYLGFEQADIRASESPSIEPSVDNGLKIDGWIITFDLEMPNTSLNLCN